jgi:hypothetical protein
VEKMAPKGSPSPQHPRCARTLWPPKDVTLANGIAVNMFQHQLRNSVRDFLKQPMGISFELFETVLLAPV